MLGLFYNPKRWLERQKQLIHSYAKDKGYVGMQILSDVGSGLNEKRKGLLRLLEIVTERKVSRLIVAYEGRLTRFGFGTLKKISFRNRNRGNKQRGEDSSEGAR
jgi:predicted site-specific integrase-resolvase